MLSIEQIKSRMSDRNISEVARRLNITRPYLSNIINGKYKPSYDMLKKISDYLETHQCIGE